MENAVQVLILLGMGGMAGAVSFTHVHDWAVLHGQLSWVGWTDAVVTELTSIACGIEVRRRKKTARSTTVALVVLMAAVIVSLTAQVSQAEPSLVGWVAAALPQLGLLAAVKIVLGRTAPTAPTAVTGQVTEAQVSSGRHAAGPDPALDRPVEVGPDRDQQPDRGPGHPDLPDRTLTAPVTARRSEPGPDPVTSADRTAPVPVQAPADQTPDRTAGPREVQDPITATAPTPKPTDEFDPDLVALGRTVLTDLIDGDRPVNRGTFAMGIRAAGGTVATNTAGALLRVLRQEIAA